MFNVLNIGTLKIAKRHAQLRQTHLRYFEMVMGYNGFHDLVRGWFQHSRRGSVTIAIGLVMVYRWKLLGKPGKHKRNKKTA